MSKVALKRFSFPRSSEDFRVDSLALLIDIAKKQEAAGLPAISQEIMLRRYWQYLSFLQRHGFTTRKIASSLGEVDARTELRNSDLTDEGFRFVQYSHDRWLDRTYKDGGESKEEQMLERWLATFRILREPNNALQATREDARASAQTLGKDMERPMAVAKERVLKLEDVGLVGAEADEVKRFCDSFARSLVERYLRDEMSWVDGDMIANNYFELMILHCGREMPAYAWDVYLAFDEGEIQDRGDTFTRARVRELQRQSGYA